MYVLESHSKWLQKYDSLILPASVSRLTGTSLKLSLDWPTSQWTHISYDKALEIIQGNWIPDLYS